MASQKTHSNQVTLTSLPLQVLSKIAEYISDISSPPYCTPRLNDPPARTRLLEPLLYFAQASPWCAEAVARALRMRAVHLSPRMEGSLFDAWVKVLAPHVRHISSFNITRKSCQHYSSSAQSSSPTSSLSSHKTRIIKQKLICRYMECITFEPLQLHVLDLRDAHINTEGHSSFILNRTLQHHQNCLHSLGLPANLVALDAICYQNPLEFPKLRLLHIRIVTGKGKMAQRFLLSRLIISVRERSKMLTELGVDRVSKQAIEDLSSGVGMDKMHACVELLRIEVNPDVLDDSYPALVQTIALFHNVRTLSLRCGPFRRKEALVIAKMPNLQTINFRTSPQFDNYPYLGAFSLDVDDDAWENELESSMSTSPARHTFEILGDKIDNLTLERSPPKLSYLHSCSNLRQLKVHSMGNAYSQLLNVLEHNKDTLEVLEMGIPFQYVPDGSEWYRRYMLLEESNWNRLSMLISNCGKLQRLRLSVNDEFTYTDSMQKLIRTDEEDVLISCLKRMFDGLVLSTRSIEFRFPLGAGSLVKSATILLDLLKHIASNQQALDLGELVLQVHSRGSYFGSLNGTGAVSMIEFLQQTCTSLKQVENQIRAKSARLWNLDVAGLEKNLESMLEDAKLQLELEQYRKEVEQELGDC